MAAIPYFVVWIVLWHRLPGTPPDWLRWGALIVGGALGLSGLAVYLWGRLTLGSMYNVSSVLGSELYADHRLIEAGPFRFVRHPMYFGIALAAVGALMVYRTWAMVFAVAALPAFAVKARHEERLLTAEFGAQWKEYTERVPSWWPRRPRRLRRPHVLKE
jgi:protein-S-isoprenylcysteine O-methyltransferase Ste14